MEIDKILYDKEVAWVEHIVQILENNKVTPAELKHYLELAIKKFEEKG